MDNSVSLTLQDGTQAFQCEHGDGLVMLQIVDGSGIDAVLVDQRVGGNALLLHGFP